MSNSPPGAAQPRSTGLAHDALAGFQVFLIALPLSLGIAMASGFPPVAGLLTAMVGGLLGPFLGSARLTIKGPAAGLIVVALGAVTELGEGDLTVGYRRALAVGVIAAAIQIVFALTRASRIAAIAPPSVVHGMLAAIGVILFAKQAHVVMGVTPHGKGPLELLAEIPWSVMHENPEVLTIGAISLALLFAWPHLARRVSWLARVPAPLAVLAVAVPLGLVFRMDVAHDYALFGHSFHLGPELLLTLPANLADAVVFPDFSVVFGATSLRYIAMFALVGALESTLSVLAVDALDPAKSASNLDRDLLTVGVGNLLAASIGGLPMISEIVRSKANLDAGAKSPWANFFHGAFLLGFVASVPGLLHYIPLAALGAMLVYTASRLASPSEVLHVRHLGLDQLLLFGTTLMLTLAEDLLVGVGVGIALKVLLHALRAGTFRGLFTTRAEAQRDGETLTVRVFGPATFLALPRVKRAFAGASDPTVTRAVLDLSGSPLVDHTFLERLHGLAGEWPTAELVLVGHERLTPVSAHPFAARRAVRT